MEIFTFSLQKNQIELACHLIQEKKDNETAKDTGGKMKVHHSKNDK